MADQQPKDQQPEGQNSGDKKTNQEDANKASTEKNDSQPPTEKPKDQNKENEKNPGEGQDKQKPPPTPDQEPTDKTTDDTSNKEEVIAKKIKNKVGPKTDKIWDNELDKIDRPDWLTLKAFKVSLVSTGITTLILGGWIGSFIGMSPSDHSKALKKQKDSHTLVIKAKDKSITDLTTKLVKEKATIILSQPLHPYTTGMIRTNSTGDRIVTAPFALFAIKSDAEKTHLFNEISANAPQIVGVEEITAFEADNIWDAEGRRYRRNMVILPTGNTMGSPAGNRALNKGLDEVKKDLRLNYPTYKGTSISHIFKRIPGGGGTPDQLQITRDLGADLVDSDPVPAPGTTAIDNDLKVIAYVPII